MSLPHCFEFPSRLVSLDQILDFRAAQHGTRPAFTFLSDGIAEQPITYAELATRAKAIAAFLQSRGAAGEPVLLCHPQGLEFVASFLGCFYAGALAVPAYPPRNRRHAGRIAAIVDDSRARIVLTSGSNDRELRTWLTRDGAPAIDVVSTDTIETSLSSAYRPQSIVHPGDLAYLQYTSGSTATPRGVMVTHENVLRNTDACRDGFGFTPDGITVSWLPLFHDMGLVLTLIAPLMAGNPVYLMTPAAFVQRPLRWLEAVSKYRATHSSGPNFAFDVCVDRIAPEQREGLDLRSWVVAVTGSEPVRKSTIERFNAAFAPQGLSPRTLLPAYGMAEATLLVSCKRPGAEILTESFTSDGLRAHRATVAHGNESATDLVVCGAPVLDTTVVVVDPETRRACAPGSIGEVWVQAPGVARGYWRNEEKTEQLFHARLESGEGPYLRTGDLGFLHDGQIVITGRIKELIILRGRNHYPHDIEDTVQDAHPCIERGNGVAFSVDVDDEERLIVVQEVSRTALRTLNAEEALAAIRLAVIAGHDVDIHDLLLVAPLEVPKTSSGKAQRSAARERYLADEFKVVARRRAAAASGSPKRDRGASIRQWLVTQLADLRGIPPGEIDDGQPFSSYGVDSLLAVRLSGDLEAVSGVALPPTLLYDYPTIGALTAHLASLAGTPSASGGSAPLRGDRPPATADEPIAIVGIGCRFPGADSPERFWQLLRDGVDMVGDVPAGRWPAGVTARGGFLDNVDGFDAAFFGISPREAVDLDPQQRLLLEVSWSALEDAAIAPASLAGTSAGVFVGLSTRDYTDLVFDSPDRSAYAGTGTSASAAAGRLSYTLGLEGPSLVVDTACSSSLVAVHLAAQSLRAGECRIALAGAANLMLSPDLTDALSQARMLSPGGQCKTFDSTADGYVRGEGGGVVVLKRLSDAIADGDRVRAIIRGSAVNQDGRTNGLTAPSGRAQERVIRAALQAAHVDAADIGYVEAHGTGTSLGDPIEVHALARAFGARPASGMPAYLGSVKTNIGHLEAAAGLAGLIKVVLCLEHGEIAPHLHLHTPSTMIAWDTIPFDVATTRRPWPSDRARRLAGISSFGFVGTNAHVIVEGADLAPAAAPHSDARTHVLFLSARSDAALRDLARRYEAAIVDGAIASDVCATAAIGRAHFDHRLALVGASAADFRQQLAAFAAGRLPVGAHAGARRTNAPGVVFFFTGQGSQYAGMGRELYETQPVFRRAIDECDAILRDHLDVPLLQVLYGDDSASLIDRTEYSQPALFAIEWALCETWRSWGVAPVAVIGHSVGEYVAACAAGVFPLADGLRVIAARGRAMQQAPGAGAMSAVAAGEAEVLRTIAESGTREVAIAAVNGPSQCVISGAVDAVDRLAALFQSRGIACDRLNVSHGFHSPLMLPAADALDRALADVTFAAPRIPIVSNLTGREAEASEIATPSYWRRQLLSPVRFADGVATLQDRGFNTFLELGPQPTLLALARAAWTGAGGAWAASLRRNHGDNAPISDAVASLYAAGVDIEWRAFHHAPARRVALPTYPFEHERFWPAAANRASTAPLAADGHALLGSHLDLPAERGIIWTRRLELASSRWLEEHCVEGAVVYPGTAHLENALIAGQIALGMPAELADIQFERPLVVGRADVFDVQTHCVDGRVSIYSRPANAASEWTRHCVMSIRPLDLAARALAVPHSSSACPERVDTARFYDLWRTRGNQWRGAFSSVADLQRGKGTAVARVTCPEGIGETRLAHPAVLDSCVHALVAAIPESSGGTLVGRSVRAVRVYESLGSRVLWSHATLRDSSSARQAEGDIAIFADDNRLVAELSGVRFEFIDFGHARAADRWLQEPHWVPAEKRSPRTAGVSNTRVFVDVAGPAALADALSGVLSSVEEFRRARSNGELALVTRGAWTLPGDASSQAPLAGAVWGLARTLAAENPDLRIRLVDLDPASAETVDGDTDRALAATDATEIAVRRGVALVPQIRALALGDARLAPQLRDDATYLITGGLGALGLVVAQWVVQHGGRHLALMGRTLRDHAAVRDLERMGATVHLAQVDVRDKAALQAWRDDHDARGRPAIRGVFHLAGVLEQIPSRDLTRDAIAGQIDAKVRGAVALDEMFADRLDAFVLFSSVSASIGSPGLAAYAAANGALDALAMARRSRCGDALSIQWPAWSGLGMAAAVTNREARRGADALPSIERDEALALLDRIWHAPVARVSVMPARAIVSGDADQAHLLALEPAERRAGISSWLLAQTAQVLRLPADRLEPVRPLNQYGLDSLMALELRNRIQNGLGIALPLIELIRGASVEQIVRDIEGRAEAADSVTAPTMVAVEGTDWPLTAAQHAQWLLNALDPRSASYHIGFAARVSSAVNVAALNRAWSDLRQRHPMLRASFARAGDRVTQRVRPATDGEIESIVGPFDDERALEAAVRNAYERPFDLERGEPSRLCLISRRADDHVLLLVAHHIACDGWSLWVLLQELRSRYEAASNGGGEALPPLQQSYIDHVQREQALLAGAEGDRLWRYWQRRLEGELPVLDLPTDRPRRLGAARQGASYRCSLPAELTADLRRLAQSKSVTLFSVLAAAFNVLLHRYSGQDDILVGMPTTGRTHAAVDRVVGNFVNQLVLRSDLSGDPAFDDLLVRTRDAVLDALAHEGMPFPLLVQRLRPGREADRSPIFQVNFVYQQAQQAGELAKLIAGTDGATTVEWGDLTLATFPFAQQEGQFDLTLELLEAGDRLAGSFKYDASLFDEATIARMDAHFRTLLQSAATSPREHISALPMLTAGERRECLAVARGAGAEFPVTACLHELFERQVARDGQAIAVVAGGEHLTYAQLNERANALAHHLRKRGAGPETLVALLLEPGVDTVVAILAALKAGAAYLPIDASAPADRIAFMLEDSRAVVLVTHGALRERATAAATCPVVCVTTDHASIALESSENPAAGTEPGNTAYCIYTSGTTGRPKGVLIEHRQVVRLLDATKSWFDFGAGDTWTLFHSYAFDFSVWEIWGALLYGGRLIVVPHGTTRSPEAFHRLVCDERVTVLNQTPSAFREFMAADARASVTPSSLRTVIFGGEALDARMLQSWMERHGDTVQLVNMYGITETTVHVTYAPVRPADLSAPGNIGVPIPDLQTYVLDAHGEPAPVGVRGEIYVGGAGLARGYLQRPELTAERFVPDPFSRRPGARLYRTGDLARYRADGCIEYLGRIDRQVKIRGFRIERGEIEDVLRRHPAIQDAIVLARDGAGGVPTLAAYLVCDGPVPQADDVRRHLRAALPEYMVPAILQFVDAFPLTGNGKIDSRALAAMAVVHPTRTTIKPSTDTERIIAGVWQDVLMLAEVGVADNFFDLGGHSLLMPQVHQRLKEHFSGPLAMVDLFRYPTVADLAAYLSGFRSDGDGLDAHEDRAQMRQARRRGRVRVRDLDADEVTS